MSGLTNPITSVHSFPLGIICEGMSQFLVGKNITSLFESLLCIDQVEEPFLLTSSEQMLNLREDHISIE